MHEPASALTSAPPATALVDRLHAALADDALPRAAPEALAWLVSKGLDRLPMPGTGETRLRWQALEAVAAHDLSLAKLYEGHTDALAILLELGAADPAPTGSRWAVWAAEASTARARFVDECDGIGRLEGAKPWCSGARGCTHALLTAWRADDHRPQLVRIALDQPGIEIDASDWRAVGMAGSAAVTLRFDGRVAATAVGAPGEYLARPGFWHGGAGIAACWRGGARALALALARSRVDDPLTCAAIGRVDVALEACGAMLRETAGWIDENPRADASSHALRLRAAAEDCVSRVIEQVGRTLGAAAFCRDADFARRAADLPIFVRQSHGDRDLAALGRKVAASGFTSAWRL